MIKIEQLRSLEEVIFEYPLVLMDTSVLLRKCFEERKFKTFLKEKEFSVGEQEKFIDLLIDYLERGAPIFITESVSNEYLNGHFPYKKIIKKKRVQRDRRILNLYRREKNLSKKRKGLMDLFKEKERILTLNEDEYKLYNEFYEKNSKIFDFYGLDETDSDFLSSGRVIAKNRASTALISNDFGIIKAWGHMRYREFNPNILGFYIRINVNSFKKL